MMSNRIMCVTVVLFALAACSPSADSDQRAVVTPGVPEAARDSPGEFSQNLKVSSVHVGNYVDTNFKVGGFKSVFEAQDALFARVAVAGRASDIPVSIRIDRSEGDDNALFEETRKVSVEGEKLFNFTVVKRVSDMFPPGTYRVTASVAGVEPSVGFFEFAVN
jgi:hypothetical protein